MKEARLGSLAPELTFTLSPTSQVATFDGDTPKDDRDYIRENCNVVSGLCTDSLSSALTLGLPPPPSLLGPCPPAQHLLFDHSLIFRRPLANSQIFTNPDMLHLTILPREETWRRFFSNLRFVVVDELHTYAGLFGCHVAYVMRR